MSARPTVTLFPFLSVLLCTMGILAFLAVTFLLLSRTEVDVSVIEEPVEVRWVGAPEHVRPLLVECHGDLVRVHDPANREPRVYSLAALREEARTVRDIEFGVLAELGDGSNRGRFLGRVKMKLRRAPELRGSVSRLMDQVEIDNERRQMRNRDEEYYPVLLVYRDGIEAYEIVSYLVETTSRLTLGLEPMLKSWVIPYRNDAQAAL